MYTLSMEIGQKLDKPSSAEDMVKLLYWGDSASPRSSAEATHRYG